MAIPQSLNDLAQAQADVQGAIVSAATFFEIAMSARGDFNTALPEYLRARTRYIQLRNQVNNEVLAAAAIPPGAQVSPNLPLSVAILADLALLMQESREMERLAADQNSMLLHYQTAMTRYNTSLTTLASAQATLASVQADLAASITNTESAVEVLSGIVLEQDPPAYALETSTPTLRGLPLATLNQPATP